ncbi:transcription initiation factor IIA subunit 1-like [Cylas formicarius]|uniref:transcription initiation factor IIA subunit 1-like n=1 Tax=Cylas formicarius TaxID=197179 RepID=UPI00295876B2|nr:transcription initiation factor IIA subunit 1-like [Cylas formicarius]
MSNSLCKTSVLRIYQEVIEDVISGVRELFVEEGVDEQVLQELKQTWETKLMGTKAVQNEHEEKPKKSEPLTSTNGFPKQQPQQAQPMQSHQPTQSHVAVPVQHIVESKMVPIQITLPPQPGTDGGQRVLTIQVPASALQGNQLQKVLTGPVITATMGLPANIASSLLQQHVNAAFSSQQQSVTLLNKNIIQTDGALTFEEGEQEQNAKEKVKKRKRIRKRKAQVRQVDGSMDTSDEDEEPSDNDDEDDLDDEKDEDDHELDDEGGEEEPLNSEDDVSDDDPSDLFDTDNIVVCQYDKIIRNRNKWKFYLKDGIMSLNGLDYVFQKANGDAEW